MFYCTECAKERGWTTDIGCLFTDKVCEICGASSRNCVEGDSIIKTSCCEKCAKERDLSKHEIYQDNAVKYMENTFPNKILVKT
jgi:hypothetical protein